MTEKDELTEKFYKDQDKAPQLSESDRRDLYAALTRLSKAVNNVATALHRDEMAKAGAFEIHIKHPLIDARADMREASGLVTLVIEAIERAK